MGNLTPAKSPETRGDTDALTLYLREVGQVALLEAEEEAALALHVQTGDEAAREHMIRANLRLVVKIARDYDNLGLPLLDLINEGNLGLMKSVERFDPSRGTRLSTYATWSIRQHIRRAIANQAKMIRLPVSAVDQIYHLRKACAKLEEILGREPSDAELARELGLGIRRVAELRAANFRPTSLDAPVGDDDSACLGDLVADENAADPSQRMEMQNSIHRVGELLDRLPEREATILRLRFGLGSDAETTLEAVSEAFGLTRERIRQLQNHALLKLRRMLEENDQTTAVA